MKIRRVPSEFMMQKKARWIYPPHCAGEGCGRELAEGEEYVVWNRRYIHFRCLSEEQRKECQRQRDIRKQDPDGRPRAGLGTEILVEAV